MVSTFKSPSVLHYIGIFLMIIIGFSACSKEEECDTMDITYSNYIGDVIDKSCANTGCHVAGAPMGSLESYDEAVAFINIDKMISALRHEEGFSAMPKNGDMLTECAISKIEAWIEDGMPE